MQNVWRLLSKHDFHMVNARVLIYVTLIHISPKVSEISLFVVLIERPTTFILALAITSLLDLDSRSVLVK